MELEDQEPGPSAGSPGAAEQTSASTRTESPQQAAALCSTTLPQEPLTCKTVVKYSLIHTTADVQSVSFTNETPACLISIIYDTSQEMC